MDRDKKVVDSYELLFLLRVTPYSTTSQFECFVSPDIYSFLLTNVLLCSLLSLIECYITRYISGIYFFVHFLQYNA